MFHRLAVKALAGERLAAQVELRLASLIRKELIRPHPATIKDDEAFRFRHLLIRDAAYDALPKATRAELHERFARWLEQHATDLLELDEIAGWHLEQAIRFKQELGQAADPQLARDAAEHLYASGARAAERRDMAAALNLLERALALTSKEDSLHARIAIALADSLVAAGDYKRLDELLLAAAADPEVAPLATLVRLEWLENARPDEFFENIGLLPEVIDELERRGDARGLAKAHWVAHVPHNFAMQATAMAEELRKAAEYAGAAGDEGMRTQALGWYLAALWFGTTPTSEIARELDSIESESEAPGPYLAAWLDHIRAALHAAAGRFEKARLLSRRACDQMELLGQRVQRGAMLIAWAEAERWAENPAGARDRLLEADEVLAEAGERGFRSTVQAGLARAYERLCERDAAIAAIDHSEALGATEDIFNVILTHGVRARLALADGDLAEAERWARSAARYASQTDYVSFQDAELELARILAAVGKGDEADSHAKHALAVFEAKGNQPEVAKARAFLATL